MRTRTVLPMSSSKNPPRILVAIVEAAERLGTTTRFLRRVVAERRIPYVKIGRHVRFDVADLDAFIATGRVEPLPR